MQTTDPAHQDTDRADVDPDAPPQGDMPLLEHIGELRSRLLICLLSITTLSIGAFYYSGNAFSVLSAPYFQAFPGDQLIGTGPAEAFLLKIKVSIFIGLLLSSPVLFHQVWQFISPGLYEHERKYAIPFVLITSLLFLTGVFFCYKVVLPYAYEFFKGQYDSMPVTPTIRITEHLAILLKSLLGAGVVFELPVLAFLLGRMGVITHHTLLGAGRYAVVVIFLLAAFLTPPDILTQFLLAGPLLLLYGISIVIVKYTGKGDPK